MQYLLSWIFLAGLLHCCFGQSISSNPILHCLSCKGRTQANIISCNTLTECNDKCIVNTTILADGTWMKSFGCAKEVTCSSSQDLIGKRAASSPTTEYCQREICNTDLTHFQEPSSDPCGDLSADDCRDPTALQTICSDCDTAQYCRKSCGLCRDHSGTWFENTVLFDYDVVHKTCRHGPTVSSSICHSIQEAYHSVYFVVNNNYTNGAREKKDYLILADVDSYIVLRFRTNGEPLTNVQLNACKTTGKGRVDILLNNNAIEESYNETSTWSLTWQIHKLNPNQYQNVRDYQLVIRKDNLLASTGHYWLSHVRLESVIAHHGHASGKRDNSN